MKANLTFHTDTWPRCYYDTDLLCGDRKTGALWSYKNVNDQGKELVRRGWHIADMCACPSCPLRCAIAEALRMHEDE